MLEGPRCASFSGFSLHADIACKTNERKKLETLVRYIARPPVAIDRLSIREDGLIRYKLKKRYKDGTEFLLFSPLELMEKLSALVPPPRAHIIRYHGVFAPHSKSRAKIVLSETKKREKENLSPNSNQKKRERMSWAELLNRVFEIDLTKCHFCRGEVKIIAAIIEKKAIEKILRHMGHPLEPPQISPARPPPQVAFNMN
ncbi:MAG: hypothetical protein A3F16_05285 [Deltaproteobacteria bacterium RIFCSPHIGHO2_12_FULL_43_9]|nr:MAG: hypothetical protein A3F16_05285 [Deltaproteobacteria bacterium RIFCSPHIGHO2_12_FULL_43_9]